MRIAIVNDMKMTVELLRRIISISHELAWVAYDGKEAVEKCSKDVPDLILMDLIMPVMDGVKATEEIMKTSPCAILIVTASVGSNASKVFEAMGHGALDVVRTPALDPQTNAIASKDLINKIERIALLIGKARAPEKMTKKGVQKSVPLLLIGASTGGPMALAQILSKIPQEIAAVIIQHVDEDFASGLASWLSSLTGKQVVLAEEGMRPEKGVILLAGKSDHLIMEKEGLLRYTEVPIENPYRPSVDVFYNSVAIHWQKPSLAIVLTGMGADGAKGLKALKDAGWHTIAQDEESSVVFGMPKAAIALGGAKEILPLSEIAQAITNFFQRAP